ncbi:hypothetical protein [Streptomyces sp. NPDC050355]|uniref:hypothetical protein n=1 Tax=Streptomyces sp. NPDC050355 TaxID=3365609 RepID=UPI0037A841FD
MITSMFRGRARWAKGLRRPRLCVAIADRLTFGGNIIETGTDSYGFAATRPRSEHQAGCPIRLTQRAIGR